MVALDKRANIILMNKKGREILGCKGNKQCDNGKINWIKTFIPKENRKGVKKIFDSLMKGKEKIKEVYENPIITSDGTKKLIRWYNTLIKDKKGKITGTLSSGEDISDEKKLEQTKKEFIAFVSHQLKGPISSGNFGIEFLLSESVGPLTKKQAEYLKEIHKKNRQMISLIDMFLDIAKIESGIIDIHPKKLSINKQIITLVREFIPEINEKLINISLNLDEEIKKITIDQNLLQIMIRNLIANAVKYSRQNGKIKIKTKAHDEYVMLTVKDTGIGIPKFQQKKVFTKMFRADNTGASNVQGSGLGLYITKKIVEGMRGKIWFKSVKNKGTTFYVKIPTKKIVGKKQMEEFFK